MIGKEKTFPPRITGQHQDGHATTAKVADAFGAPHPSTPKQAFEAIGLDHFFVTDDDKDLDWAALISTKRGSPVDGEKADEASGFDSLGQEEAFHVAAYDAVTEDDPAEDAVWERYLTPAQPYPNTGAPLMPTTEHIATLDEQGYLHLRLDQPPGTQVRVIIEAVETHSQPETENFMLASLQSQTGFALKVLGSPAEDAWNDL
jgi:hypothetical protein